MIYAVALNLGGMMVNRERLEEYLGAVCRLRRDPESPVPLSLLVEYFGFSPVSIHEMVQKLARNGWVVYRPYHGVTLTESGEAVALALLRRHRLWERFLMDVLQVPWDEAHEVAGDLEHAAPESVTERLANLLGDPDFCPHGEPIPPMERTGTDQPLERLPAGASAHVTRIGPESGDLLRKVQAWDLVPGALVTCLERGGETIKVQIGKVHIQIPPECARAIWVEML